jgi:DUF1707 SHOCT-like domain
MSRMNHTGVSMMMDDRFRTSDADRDHVAARLREHFAEGRLTHEELDERLTAALNAKTYGDLRRVLADLPEPGPALAPGRPSPRLSGQCPVVIRRGPRLLPLALLVLAAALVLPSAGWVFIGVLKVILLAWLAGCVATIIVASRFRRLARQHWHGHGYHHDESWPGWRGHDRSRHLR